MATKIAMWGNSNAVRLPADLVAETGLLTGTPVRFEKREGGILIAPDVPRYTIGELMKHYRPEHRHEPTDWGNDVGNEIVE